MWVIESDTEKLTRDLFRGSPKVPPREQKIGAATVRWWEGQPGDAVVMAEGGSPDDRYLAEQVVAIQLEGVGYKRARFTFESMRHEGGWPDIMQKAKRLIQSGMVTVLRNGYNNIVGHVIGDHGEYNTEIGRDDPNSQSITTWQCECPWDQYAWQRTRQWKKYEGRPCAHVMALYWQSKATPLDDDDPEKHGPMPGQKMGPAPEGAPPGGGGGGGSGAPAGPPLPKPGAPPTPSPVETPSPAGLAPPSPSGALPTPPMDQLAEQVPPVPGQTPAGMPANPNIVSVPGAKVPSPFNPIQFPGGTYSKVAAEEFSAPEIVRLRNEGYGMAEGKSEAHGAGQYQPVPEGSTGEVLGQDPTTGWVEIIVPLEGGPLSPYHVRLFVDPKDIEHTGQSPPGPFIKRRR